MSLINGIPQWVHVSTIGINGGGLGKMADWKMVETAPPNANGENPRSGQWRITQAGMDFYRGRVCIPKKAIRSYRGYLIGFCGDPVMFMDCVDSRFVYSEVVVRPT